MQTSHKSTIYLFVLLLILGALPLFWLQKGDVVLFLNNQHNPVLDNTFKFFSMLGNGVIFIPILLFMLFRNFKAAVITAGVFIVQAILCVLCKEVVYHGALRPKAFFGDAVPLTPVEGVTHFSLNAFPSGHTATAFAAALLIALFVNNRTIRLVLLAYGLLVAFSRLYLAQHFYLDTVAGALIGIFSAGAVWIIASEYNWPHWSQKRLHLQRKLSESL